MNQRSNCLLRGAKPHLCSRTLLLLALCVMGSTLMEKSASAQQGRLPATFPNDGAGSTAHANDFEADVEAIEEHDKLAAPIQNSILFIGSSIFVQWSNLRIQMDPLPVYNRAFGGSRTWEMLHYMDRLVIPYQPSVIVYYCGSNDINVGEPPSAISGRFKEFCERINRELPATKILYVSIIKAPQKMSHWDDVDQANRQVKEYSHVNRRVEFIDVNTMFFKKLGQPRMEVYQLDGLHLVPNAYDELTALVRPSVEKAWRNAKRGDTRKKSGTSAVGDVR